jgi:eukaryotic-like serine/threonine-protein kinase
MQACRTLSDQQPVSVAFPRRRPQSGDRIANRYVLIALLGEGGMGSVWRARCSRFDLDVAIKLVRGASAFPGSADRLRVEAHAAARVRHAATVRVFDFGTTEHGEPYLVMELLLGASLAELIRKRGPLPELSAVRLLLPVAGALAAAHESGIIHRDLKPANILLVPREDDDGCQPKLLDFGIAKIFEDAPADSPLTERGMTLGSVGYMAPEQVRGDLKVEPTADVWALAVVLYELITGELPFQETGLLPYFAAILKKDPRPTTDLREGDPELWAILQRGLAREPTLRWQSMAAFRAALAHWAFARGAREDVSGALLETSAQAPASRRRPAAPSIPVVQIPAEGWSPASERRPVIWGPLSERRPAARLSSPGEVESIAIREIEGQRLPVSG